MSNGKLVKVNGKMVVVPDDGATVADMRSQLGNTVGSDSFIAGDKQLSETDVVKPGSSVWTMPQIVKGAPGTGKVNGKLVVLPQNKKQDPVGRQPLTGLIRVNGRLIAAK